MCVSMIIGIFKAVLSCLLLCYPCYPCYLLLSVLLVFNFLSQGTWFVLFASSQSILRETRRGGVHISSSAMVTSRARRKVMGLSGAASFLVEETAITPNAVSPTKLIKRFTWMLGCLMFCEYKMLVLLSNQDQHLCWKNIVSRFGLPWRRGGVFGADGLAGRPMAPSRLQVDVSESTNSVVAPIACPQAGCLWVGPMAMLQKTCTLGMFGSRLALPLVVATWQKVAVSAWWPKWHPENGFHCLFNLRLHSLQLSFHLGVILGKLGNLLGDFTKDPNTWNFFQQVWFSGGRILYEILRLPPLESYFHVKRCLWRSRQLT